MNKYLFVLMLLIWSFNSIAQQTDSVNSSVVLINPHSANRAANLSAMLPGLGQVYNKQAWKVPIIYAGAGALVYSIVWNNNNYQKYLNAYKLDSDTSSSTNSEFSGLYTVQNLITLKDYYRRNRDFSAIGLVLVYAANIIDAYVYAQFYNFDISDDLTLRVQPMVVPQINNFQTGSWSTVNGLSLTLRFK